MTFSVIFDTIYFWTIVLWVGVYQGIKIAFLLALMVMKSESVT